MKGILEALHGVMGVEGVLFCDHEGRVVASTFPQAYNPQDVAKVGYAFSLGVQAVSAEGKRPQAIYATFEKGRLIVRPFEKGLIVVLGSDSLRPLLLKAALEKALKELAKLESGNEGSTGLSAAIL